jgi:hypothetical protein
MAIYLIAWEVLPPPLRHPPVREREPMLVSLSVSGRTGFNAIVGDADIEVSLESSSGLLDSLSPECHCKLTLCGMNVFGSRSDGKLGLAGTS